MTDVKFTGTSDFEKVKKDYEELARKTAKVEDENRKLKQTTERAGKARKDAFGASAVAELRTMATGMVSVGTAIGLARDAMAYFRAETERGFASVERLAESTRRLNQIALTGMDLAGLQKKADELAERYGYDRDTTQQLLFNARSLGYEPMAERIISLNQVVDPVASSVVVGKVPGLFKRDKISGEQALAMTFAAAAESELNFEQIAEALPKLSEGAGLAASSTSEALAFESVMTSRFSSGKTTADRGAAFATKVAVEPGLAGKGIIGAFDVLAAMPEKKRREFLGDSNELNAVYNILSEERDNILQRQQIIELERERAGTPASRIEQARIRALNDPRMIAQRKLRTQEISKELLDERHAMEKLGSGEGEVQAMRNTTNLTLGRWTASKAAGFAKDLEAGERWTALAGTAAGYAGEALVGVGRTMLEQLFPPLKYFRHESDAAPEAQLSRSAGSLMAAGSRGDFQTIGRVLGQEVANKIGPGIVKAVESLSAINSTRITRSIGAARAELRGTGTE